jgi:hypothetical protein
MAVADAGLTAWGGGGASRVEWAGSRGGAGADRRPTHLALEPKQELPPSPLGGPGVSEGWRPDLSPAGPFPRNGEEERRVPLKGGVRSRVAMAAVHSSSLRSSQISLHR